MFIGRVFQEAAERSTNSREVWRVLNKQDERLVKKSRLGIEDTRQRLNFYWINHRLVFDCVLRS